MLECRLPWRCHIGKLSNDDGDGNGKENVPKQ